MVGKLDLLHNNCAMASVLSVAAYDIIETKLALTECNTFDQIFGSKLHNSHNKTNLELLVKSAASTASTTSKLAKHDRF